MSVNRQDIIFDYRLGYIRADTALSGFDIIGENGAPKILILGGYTTTEQAKSGRSWVNYLYKLFKEANKSVQIING